jgi:hypothetical protein
MPEITLDEDTHKYTVDGRIIDPSVTGLLKAVGLIDGTWFTEFGRLRGQLTHKAIKYFNDGELDEETVDPVLKPFFHGYLSFLADTGFVVVNSELIVYEPTLDYIGTLDLEGFFPRNPKIQYIGDTKTGKMQDWTKYQLALYRKARALPRRRFGLELHANGTYKIVWFTDPYDEAEALGLLKKYRKEALCQQQRQPEF